MSMGFDICEAMYERFVDADISGEFDARDEEAKTNKIWRMRNGLDIDVKNMSISHILRAMKYADKDWLKIFQEELMLRNQEVR